MKTSCLLKSKFIHFSLLFLFSISSTFLYGSQHNKDEWEVLEKEIRSEQDKNKSSFENIARLYVSMNSRSKGLKEIFDRESYLVKRNMVGCLVYGAAAGACFATDFYKKEPTISMINTIAFTWFLYHSYHSFSNYTHMNYSLNNYNQLREFIRSILSEKLGEGDTLLIDSLSTSDEDLRKLHSLLQDCKTELDEEDWFVATQEDGDEL